MNYELAKELKDAGFPFKACRMPDYPEDCSRELYYNEHIPTLSELIEACGDGFACLSRIYLKDKSTTDSKNKWNAGGFGIFVINEGPTAEEAVARLYLSLHGKKADQA